MDIIYGIIADLPSKQFGNTTLYFDKKGQNVVAIDQGEKLTYAVINGDETELITAMIDGVTISCTVNLKDLFVIPEITERSDIKLLDGQSLGEYAEQLCNMVYEVADYGMLNWQNCRNALFSRAKINVAVINPQGQAYQITMTVGEGVRGCDGNPHGDIENAYKIKPIGIFKDEVFIATI